jgi:hypothetical protein
MQTARFKDFDLEPEAFMERMEPVEYEMLLFAPTERHVYIGDITLGDGDIPIYA